MEGSKLRPKEKDEQFDTLSFIGIAVYKVGVLLINVVPYIALVIAA